MDRPATNRTAGGDDQVHSRRVRESLNFAVVDQRVHRDRAAQTQEEEDERRRAD